MQMEVTYKPGKTVHYDVKCEDCGKTIEDAGFCESTEFLGNWCPDCGGKMEWFQEYHKSYPYGACIVRHT